MTIKRKFGIQYRSCDVCDQRAVYRIQVVDGFADLHDLKRGLKYDLCRQCAIENHKLLMLGNEQSAIDQVNNLQETYQPWLEKEVEV